MTIAKKCQNCGTGKPISEFFCASFSGPSHGTRTGKFCKQCHAEGKIKYGYGWHGFGGKYATPEDATA